MCLKCYGKGGHICTVWDCFLFYHKALNEYLVQPKRKCLFSLCKFHFLNVGYFLQSSSCSSWNSLLRQIGDVFCSSGYDRGLKLVFVHLVIPPGSFLFLLTYGQVAKERFFLLLFIYIVSSVDHLFICLFVGWLVTVSSWGCSRVQVLLISWCSTCLAMSWLLLLELPILLWDAFPTLGNPIGILG